MTDLRPHDGADERARLAFHIKQSAAAAVDDPDKESKARMDILGHLLNPAARVIEQAILRREGSNRFPTIDRERIADYITRRIEHSVLGFSANPLDLSQLAADVSPFAWSDRFATACVQSGITEVRRARERGVGMDIDSLADSTPLAPVTALDLSERALSAEDLYLVRERRRIVTALSESIETWDERCLTAAERDVERSVAVRTLMGIPAAAVADDTHKRWVAAFLHSADAHGHLRRSLVAHRDLADGDPQWHQLSVDDRLLDLWADYSSEDASLLLNAPAQAIMALAREAAHYPPRPRETKRVAVRRLLKKLTVYRGWPSTVMRLEKAWSAQYFDAHCEGESRDGFEVEGERAAAAADWHDAAAAALSFPGRPFGPSVTTVQDVCDWMMRAYRMTSQMTAQKDAA